jgi:hypothetical protein
MIVAALVMIVISVCLAFVAAAISGVGAVATL